MRTLVNRRSVIEKRNPMESKAASILTQVIKDLSALKEQLIDKRDYVEVCVLRDCISTLRSLIGTEEDRPTVADLIGVVSGLFSDPEKLNAIKELGLRGRESRDAVPALISVLRDDEKSLRKAGAWALERIFADSREQG